MLRALFLWSLLASVPHALADEAEPAAVEQAAVEQDAEMWVVKIHADWCAGCRRLGDVETQLRPQLGEAEVRFITFDLTDSRTTVAAEHQARALGLDAVLAGNQGRLGTVLLVDPGSREVVEWWTANDSFERMARGIQSEASKREKS